MDGICALVPPSYKDTARRHYLEPEGGPSPDPEAAGTFTLDFSTSKL
jgi:hypothetical protein